MRFVNFLIKPASSLCNLRCRYCFYADEAAHRAAPSLGVMAGGTVDTLLTEAFCTVEPGGAVSFAFQGGEPTVAGLEFFRQFAARAHTLCPKGVKMNFSIQTNGTLLDEEWAEFFRQERFLVGLSLDGFKDLHDHHRVDAEGAGTWNRVAKAARLLQSRGVEVNALCVVTGQCARSPEKAYNSLKKLGLRYLQFIACLDPIGVPRGCMPYSLTAEVYGRFLCRLFDLCGTPTGPPAGIAACGCLRIMSTCCWATGPAPAPPAGSAGRILWWKQTVRCTLATFLCWTNGAWAGWAKRRFRPWRTANGPPPFCSGAAKSPPNAPGAAGAQCAAAAAKTTG